MSEHPTLEPTALDRAAIAHLRAGEPSGDADITAMFTDLVCADHELLRAEFDAIISANFPTDAAHPQRRDPAAPPAIATDRAVPRAGATPSPPAPGPVGGTGAPPRRWARQRGPPLPTTPHPRADRR